MSSTPPITKRRRKLLRSLCKARCNGDRDETKKLIHTMETQFARMSEGNQEAVLAAMARTVNLLSNLTSATSTPSATSDDSAEIK